MNIVINSVLHTGRAAAWRVTANQGVYTPFQGAQPCDKGQWELTVPCTLSGHSSYL